MQPAAVALASPARRAAALLWQALREIEDEPPLPATSHPAPPLPPSPAAASPAAWSRFRDLVEAAAAVLLAHGADGCQGRGGASPTELRTAKAASAAAQALLARSEGRLGDMEGCLLHAHAALELLQDDEGGAGEVHVAPGGAVVDWVSLRDGRSFGPVTI